MKTIEQDWSFIVSAVDSLQDYLLSKVIYYPLGNKRGEAYLSQEASNLTLGNLLLVLRRVEGFDVAEDRRTMFYQITQEVSRIRNKWQTNWIMKGREEFGVRLNLWRAYLDDALDSQDLAAGYNHHVRWRVILDLLKDEIGHLEMHQEEMLAVFDGKLRRITSQGPFVWEADLAQKFSRERFWYLYIVMQPTEVSL